MLILLGLAAISALLAAILWVRVASSSRLLDIARLDGTEPLFERSNRRALMGAAIASAAAITLAALGYLVG